ncbi:MAG TPA: hypothetical protein VHL11_17445 [Phototrophicaceae bacterium]|jgi:hypothetical protein|nr:hypothetical protein [Phototrophicaceae bacterium]
MARWRYSFWLDFQKDDELVLAEIIDELKHSRRFVSTIRDGIRLIADLRAGRVGVLLELFPFVREAIAPAIPLPGDGGTDNTDRRLERIEQLLLENSMGSAYQMNGLKPGGLQPMSSGGLRPMSVPQFSAPTFDDDLDTLILEKNTAVGNVSANFLSGLGGLLDEDFSGAYN